MQRLTSPEENRLLQVERLEDEVLRRREDNARRLLTLERERAKRIELEIAQVCATKPKNPLLEQVMHERYGDFYQAAS